VPFFDDPPLHDFPDRAIRLLLENPHNLRDLLNAVAPDLAARCDFERVEIVPTRFLLDDWRRRESDLLCRFPYAAGQGTTREAEVLVCVLVEHQSEPDPWMPLRTLLYGVLYWEQEWKAWEGAQRPRPAQRLTSVWPVVFHTGHGQWNTHRELADLIAGPDELRRFGPIWKPVFWNLSERTPQELLQTEGEWMQTLAVVRAEREETGVFRQVLSSVLQQLEALRERERIRWSDLLWFALSWARRRRPTQEWHQLLEAASRSQRAASHRREIRAMSETIEQTWEQEALARGEARGLLRARREDLQLLLEDRFGPLPDEVLERIEDIDDLQHLRDAILQVRRVTALKDLDL
jgi:Putative transposase, YhgA-like